MPEREQRRPQLTDLERKAFRSMAAVHHKRWPDSEMDVIHMASLARAAVDALTTGSGSGRKLRPVEHRPPAPGCTPERIRYLARQIEASYHTMPNGWISADDQLGTTYE